MKVILKQDVKKLGKKGDIVEVADGYARNFLIAKGLAVAETKKSLEVLQKQQEESAAEDAAKREEAERIAKELENMVFDFPVKTGKEGKVFGSISTKHIAEALEAKGIEIDKRKILDTNPVNQLGVTEVRVELYKDVIGIIKVNLVESE